MDAEKLEKAKAGLKACSVGVACGPNCPYEYILDIQGQAGCIATMARDALEIIKEQEARKAEVLAMLDALEQAAEAMRSEGTEAMPTHIVPRELLLHTWGHGYQESHIIGDDEDPESFDLAECVWINGHIMDERGSNANAASDYWAENYGKKYGVRVWTGDEKPTDKQREETPWT